MIRPSVIILSCMLACFACSCTRAPSTPVTSNWSIAPAVIHEVAGAEIADCFLDERGITILTRGPGRDANTLLRLDHGANVPRVLATWSGRSSDLLSPTAVAFRRDRSMWLHSPPYTKEIEVTKYDLFRFQTAGLGDHCVAICSAETTPGNYALQALVVENATGKIVTRELIDSETPRAAAMTADAAIAFGQTPERGEHDVWFSRQPGGAFVVDRRETPSSVVGRSRIAMRSDGVPVVTPTFRDDFKVESVEIDGVKIRLPEQLAIGRGWTMLDDILMYPGDRSLVLVDTRAREVSQASFLQVMPPETRVGIGRSTVSDRVPIWGRQQIRLLERVK